MLVDVLISSKNDLVSLIKNNIYKNYELIKIRDRDYRSFVFSINSVMGLIMDSYKPKFYAFVTPPQIPGDSIPVCIVTVNK